MANENNKIKLLLLWDILSKNTDENHAMNADEIREELAKRRISVMRKVIADDIAVLTKPILQGQSIHHVYATHKDELSVSEKSIYKVNI